MGGTVVPAELERESSVAIATSFFTPRVVRSLTMEDLPLLPGNTFRDPTVSFPQKVSAWNYFSNHCSLHYSVNTRFRAIIITVSLWGLQKTCFHVSQTLGYKNGYSIPQRPRIGIGGDAIVVNQVCHASACLYYPLYVHLSVLIHFVYPAL